MVRKRERVLDGRGGLAPEVLGAWRVALFCPALGGARTDGDQVLRGPQPISREADDVVVVGLVGAALGLTSLTVHRVLQTFLRTSREDVLRSRYYTAGLAPVCLN